MSIAEKLTTIVENEQKVFDAGKAQGDLSFFNMFTWNNTRTDYQLAFSITDFSGYTFPEVVRPLYITVMFKLYKGTTLPQNIDFSQSVALNNRYQEVFYGASNLQEIDFSTAPAPPSYYYTFYQCSSLKRLIVNVNENTDFTYWLTSCSALEELTINGFIGKNVGFGDCSSLNKKSIQNIIRALSPSISGRTVTLKSSAVTNAFGSTSSQEWLDLIAERKNWTINLAS